MPNVVEFAELDGVVLYGVIVRDLEGNVLETGVPTKTSRETGIPTETFKEIQTWQVVVDAPPGTEIQMCKQVLGANTVSPCSQFSNPGVITVPEPGVQIGLILGAAFIAMAKSFRGARSNG